MRREPQQVADCEVLLALAPGNRLETKLLDAAGDAGGADVDQLGAARHVIDEVFIPPQG
jgi:hypothetical protein